MLPRRHPAHASLREAIAYLASACDGAVRRDGHGFGAEHVQIGHALAKKRRWSRRDRLCARSLVQIYSRQLASAGLLGRVPRRRSRTRTAAWATDPTGVHTLRFWDGSRWTSMVRS